MEKLIEEIKNKILSLSDNNSDNKEEYSFFNSNIKSFNENNILSLKEIKTSSFLLAYIRLIKEESFFSSSERFTNCSKYIDKANSRDMDNLSQVLDDLDYFDSINVLDDINNYNSLEKVLMKKDGLKTYNDFVSKIGNFFNKDSKAILEFISLYKDFKDIDLFEKYINFYNIIEKFENEEIKCVFADKEIKKSKTMQEIVIKDVLNACSIIDVFRQFNIHYKEIETSIKRKNSSINKERISYEKLLHELINSKKENQITIKEDVLNSIENIEFKQKLLLRLLEINKNNYFKLKEEYKNNLNTEFNEFDKLLLQNNIILDNDKKIIITENTPIEEIKEILKELDNSNLSFIKDNENLLFSILLFSSNKTLKKINSLCNNTVINKSFISNNFEILLDNNKKELLDSFKLISKSDVFLKNIDLLKDNNIYMPNIKKFNIDLLLEDNNLLEKNMNMLNIYDIDLSDEQLMNYSLLENINNLDIVDSFIEIGMYNYIIKNIDIINNNPNIIKKIILSKEMKINIFDNNGYLTKEIIEDNNFYCKNDELDNYINNDILTHLDINAYIVLSESTRNTIDEETIKNPTIVELDKIYKEDDNTYNFDGIIISRNKVLRNLTSLNDLDIDNNEKIITSCLYNSILDEESINKIITNIEKTSNNSKIKKIN